jgi:hypothetical protein
MIDILVWIVELLISFSYLIIQIYSCTKWRRDFPIFDLRKHRFICNTEWNNDISIRYHFLSLPISYCDLVVHLITRWVSRLLSRDLHIEIIAWFLDYQRFTSGLQPTTHYLIVLRSCTIVADIQRIIVVIIIVSNFVKINRHYTTIWITNIRFEI